MVIRKLSYPGENIGVVRFHAIDDESVGFFEPSAREQAFYDKAVADLVSFLVWMGEPVADKRKTVGTVVLIFLAGLFVLSYALKKNYWKDIH